MNSTELIAVFRDESGDVEQPYLWSDALLYTYVDDAHKQFCRDTYGIADSRSFKIDIVADGTVWYTIDPQIIKIRDAIDTATGLPINLIAVEKMADNHMKFDGGVGQVKALVTGLDEHAVRAWPIPNEAMTIELRTFRLPADVVAGDEFEIDPQHVLNLLFWVKYRAYSVQDADARDDKRAADNRAKWDAYCAKAKVEQSRARRPVSAVTYGGI
jgi:hypothetical protein